MKDFILKRVAAIILPLMFIYGIYVILHGHVSPGGSFAGGIIVELSFIAFSTIYGLEKRPSQTSGKGTYLDRGYECHFGSGIMGMVGIFKGLY